MRKYKTKGYVIVHGQKIQVIDNIIVAQSEIQALAQMKLRLKTAFSGKGTIAEYYNCVFEKDACGGFFAEAKSTGHLHNIIYSCWLFIKNLFSYKIVKR